MKKEVLTLAVALLTGAPLAAQQPAPVTSPGSLKLAPGDFEWHPERSLSGPLLVVVSIDDQMLYAFRNGIKIASSTVSTGREGKETPTGVFSILQRKVDHESNIYKGAKMPYMQRLTWTGIAMHAGELPGYPASAGCIRLPYEFSKLIYGEMKNGSTVVITRKGAKPTKSESPASILLESRAKRLEDKAVPKGIPVWEPQKSPTGPVTALLSYSDKTLYVWRNGVQIGQCPVGLDASDPELPIGVFLMLDGPGTADPEHPGLVRHPWSVVSLEEGPAHGDVAGYLRNRANIPVAFRRVLNNIVTPGTLFIATRESSTKKTRSGPMAIGVPEEAPAP